MDVGELIMVAHTVLARAIQVGCNQTATPGTLDHITGLTSVTNMSEALTRELVYQTDQTGICQQVTRCGLTSWLTVKTNLTRRQASQLVLDARQSARFGVLRQAGLAGRVNPAQTSAITRVLKDLPSDLEPVQTLEAEQLLTGLAETCGSDVLSRASEEVLERVAPITAQDAMEAKAARNLGRASQARYLKICTHPDGTTTINGLLPALEGELVRQVISQISEHDRRTQQARTPGVPPSSRRQTQADALTTICRHITNCNQKNLPCGGATVVVTVPVGEVAQGGPGRLMVDGQLLDTQTTNTLLCDTTIMRAVIGAKQQILDIGRTSRTIPPAIRTALTLRDKGCGFPGCDRSPEACQAHHVQPWQKGGATRLDNLMFLCASHHRLVEPPRDGSPPDWIPHLREDGLWELIPPKWFDPEQTPLLHHRHKPNPPP
jgi:hypothetical protein